MIRRGLPKTLSPLDHDPYQLNSYLSFSHSTTALAYGFSGRFSRSFCGYFNINEEDSAYVVGELFRVVLNVSIWGPSGAVGFSVSRCASRRNVIRALSHIHLEYTIFNALCVDAGEMCSTLPCERNTARPLSASLIFVLLDRCLGTNVRPPQRTTPLTQASPDHLDAAATNTA